jgi:4-hydroxy-tetrahydrodipicolinate synthase
MKKFQGTGVAIVTPFHQDLSIDYAALKRLIKHLHKGGVEFLVVQGTTGESVTLSKKEKIQVLEFVKEVNDNKLPIVLGHGGNNTQALIDGFDDFSFDGVDAILSVSPYYNKPTQEGIYNHYRLLAEASPVPIILYNVPGRTASNLHWQTTMSLAHDFDKIIGTKEAAGDLEQVAKVVANTPKDFLVLSGDDALSIGHMSLGGDGVISVIANAFPKEFSSMIRSAMDEDYASARSNFFLLHPMIDYLFQEGNPGGVKAALTFLGICDEYMRPPLARISGNLREWIGKEVDRLSP